MNKKILFIILVIAVILLVSCDTLNKTKVQPQSSLAQFDKCDINKDGNIGSKERQICEKQKIQIKEGCGDGICGPIEKQRNICPEDCKEAGKTGIFCGDGTCQPIEKQRENCPEDCKEEKTKITCPNINPPSPLLKDQCKEQGSTIDPVYDSNDCVRSYKCSIVVEEEDEANEVEEEKEEEDLRLTKSYDSNDSPFAITTSRVDTNSNDFSNLNDLGVKWIRLSGSNALIWGSVEKTKGNYDWSKTDGIVTNLYNNGFNIVWTTKSFNAWDQGGTTPTGKAPNDIQSYTAFIKLAAERYDGDGIVDAPGSPVINYWRIENEVDWDHFWKDTPEKYAEILQISYDEIKSANSNAVILSAGIAGPDGFEEFFVDVLKSCRGVCFDIMDVHWYGHIGSYLNLDGFDLKEYNSNIQNTLTTYGYLNPKIWFTETGTYADETSSKLDPQTETDQANELLKRYIYFTNNGVSKTFWFHALEDVSSGTFFANVGLINNPDNDGLSHKKLAYYTYKQMIEKLEGFNSAQAIQESDNVYIYKFIKSNKPIWIAWGENSGEKQVTISGISSSQVTVTDTVPKYETGKDVTSYSSAFNTETKTVSNGQVTILLGDVPVFVEEE